MLWIGFVVATGVVCASLLLLREGLLRLRDRRDFRYIERAERLSRRYADEVLFDWDEPAGRERLGRLGQ